ncbi:BatD family protein [Nitrincola nitratireducens]|uniref:Protein BatD n=1 Tax=Nitrincola nitratireducens TaxID=1229521 RepID=W9V892_9GAMM|nr:BatD family protein [Nitrincola nitratireducens]EXJ13101.1 hypothetical protein D791_00454 [Nitrincola nitratireducens]
MNTKLKQAFITVFFICCFFSASAAAELQVNIDRQSLTLDDRALLTIEANGDFQLPPDLSPLQQDFRLGAIQRSLVTTHTAGQRQSRTRWQIPISAKTTGSVILPPLRLQNFTSEPIQLSIAPGRERAPISSTAQFNDLVIEARLDRLIVYKNAQLIMDVTLFHRQPLPDDTEFVPPYIESGRVIRLQAPSTRTAEVNREPYLVTEFSFALFPNEEGYIRIEGPALRLPEGNRFLLDELLADDLEVEVLPQVHDTHDGHWLPSENVFLSDTLGSLPLGEEPRLLRSLTLTAVGLTSDHLPDTLLLADPYPHYTLVGRESNEHLSSQGVTSVLQELWLLTPEQEGTYPHPGAEIHWWDTLSDQARITSRPHGEITIGSEFVTSTGSNVDTSTSSGKTNIEEDRDFNSQRLGLITATLMLLSVLAYTLYQRWSQHLNRRITLKRPV